MDETPMSQRLIWIAALFAIAIAIGCGQSSLPDQSITRDRCEVDAAFVFVPDGDYISGSDPTERDYAYQISAEAIAPNPDQVSQAEQRLRERRWFDFEPARQTKSLPAFCISRNLITNADYQAFIDATGHRLPGISEADYQDQGFLVHPYEDVQPFLWANGTYPDGEGQHPVVLVSYEDAIAYANWKGDQDGASYRLPTADEWEKTARSTDGRYFPWGNTWQNDATNWAQQGGLHTTEVGAYPLSRSPYGADDMAGNVFEYTFPPVEEGEETVSIMKGCSWDDLPGFCRAAYRHTRPIDSRHILFGFRLLKEAQFSLTR